MILDQLLGPQETRARTIQGFHPSSPIWQGLWSDSRPTTSGESVTETTSAALSAVYAAVRLISWTRAILSLCVYERIGDSLNDRRADKDHPVYRVLHDRPNPDMTPVVFQMQQSAYELQWGNSYAWIETTRAGDVGALWPLPAWGVQVGRFGRDRSLAYDVSALADRPMKQEILPASEILHVPNIVIPDRGSPLPTVMGKGVITYARESLGEALAAQRFGAGFFAGGSLFAFALKYPPGKKVKDLAAVRKNLGNIHGGAKRQIPILDDGKELQTYGMPLKDAQFLESRQFHVPEIARWYGVPPHKLRDLSRATFSNIAEQKLEWYEDLLPWLTLTAQEYSYKLFTDTERRKYFIQHIVENLLKGDIEKRFNAYGAALKDGWMDRDEVRRRENMNSMGPAGRIKTIQPGVENIENLLEQKDDGPGISGEGISPESPNPKIPESPNPTEARRLDLAARRTLEAGFGRMVHKEAQDARAAAAEPAKFLAWLDRYYRGYLEKMTRQLRPTQEACRSLGRAVEVEDTIFGHLNESRSQLLALSGRVTAEGLPDAVDRLVAGWEQTRAAELARGLFPTDQ